MTKKQRSLAVYDILQSKYPNVTTFLTHRNSFELLIAVILSAQCTDERVNMVTPELFRHYPSPELMAAADLDDLRHCIRSINFFNNKAKNIQETARILFEDYDSVVPAELAALVKLPGVGRKTANVVLGQAFGIPGITVDTHVKRLCTRLGFCKQSDPVKIEHELMRIWPDEIWNDMSTTLILQGREVCNARRPHCDVCELSHLCPTFKKSGK